MKKGPIEKGANDGQLTYATSIAAALRAAVTAKSLPKAPGGKTRNGKKRGKAAIADEAGPVAAAEPTPAAAKAKESDWGLFEPIHGLIGSKSVSGVLLVVLLWSLFLRSPMSGSSLSSAHTPAHRIAAYEQIWRAEEAELWKWMEERVALDRVHEAAGSKIRAAGHMQERLQNEEMVKRQVDEAIRTTEERLEVLKGVVQRDKEKAQEKEHGKSKS